MEVIQQQFLNMLPLFALILLGFVSGKLLKIRDYSLISKLILYVFTPIVAFAAIVTANPEPALILVPVIFFLTTSLIAICYKLFFSKFSKMSDALVNTLAYSAGSGNVAFYGIPAVLILLGEQFLPIILIAMIGYIVYDSSVGYLIATGEKFKLKIIIQKLLKFPPFLAIMLGFICLILGIDPSGSQAYEFIVSNSQATMATLGIFLIGLAVVNLNVRINYSYLLAISIGKVLVNPLLVFSILVVDASTFGLFNNYTETMMLMASVPVATNSVILATQFTKKEQIASLGVLVTACLSLISIPLWQLLV